jgi:hypothetical protein
MLIDEICEALLPSAAGRVVADIRIGLGYTAVQLDDGSCGLAYTFRDEIAEGCSVLKAAGTLCGRPAQELARWAHLPDPLAAATGLATLNALAGRPPGAADTGFLTALGCRPEDEAGMVGYFGPLVQPLRSRCRVLHVLDRHPEREAGILAEQAADEVLPRCDVVILTATTLINRTIDHLLDLCQGAREVAVLGPSTPMLPGLFRGTGVTLLSGIQVTDAARILRTVSEGGGTRQFGDAVKKLTVRAGE